MTMGFSVKDQVVATKIVAADGSGQFTDIQAAINDLPAGGGVVYIKEGTYTITSAITILSDNIELHGAGDSTIIYLADSSNTNILEISDYNTAIEGVRITTLQINGNTAHNNTNGYGIVVFGDPSYIVSRVDIEDCYIHHCNQDAINAYKTDGLVISRNHLKNCRYGIYLNDTTATISQNNVHNNSFDGIHLWTVYWIHPEFSGYVVTGNHVYSNVGSGIRVDETDFALITGNHCYNNTQGLGSTAGIAINDDSNRCIVNSNVCFDEQATATQKYGIWIVGADCNKNVVVGNVCYANTTEQLRNSGTNTIVEHNQTT